MSSTGHKRSDRVADRIRAELMDLITRGGLRDPGLNDCYVTSVRISSDLRHARVYVRLLREDVSEEDREKTVRALDRAAGFIRRELAPVLMLKYHPELKFFWDDNVDRAERIESLLREIGDDGKKGDES